MSKKTATITLNYPVQLVDRLLTEVEMRRPSIGDLLKYPIDSEDDIKGELALFSALVGLLPEETSNLDMEDYEKLRTQYLTFRKNTSAKA